MIEYVKRGRHPADPTGEIYGDTHWPLPAWYDFPPDMNVAINRENMTFIGIGEYRVLWAKAEESTPLEAIVIGPLKSGSTWSKFTDMELKMLYRNTTGHEINTFSYNSLLQACRSLTEGFEPLPMPDGLVKHHKAKPQPKESPKQADTKTKAQSGGVKRPKAGTATGRVWDLADALAATNEGISDKELKKLVANQCAEEGINPATAQVQFGKWKSSR
jgi:hypothetical protein